MGELESGYLHLHQVSIYEQSGIGRKIDMDQRCSGIHRGMGTHISRVKSVDLDAWTDEQLQSVLRWGNSRANKLVTRTENNHWLLTQTEGIGNQNWQLDMFPRSRTYTMRRHEYHAMLIESQENREFYSDKPLNVVQEKAKLERASSQRSSSTSGHPAQSLPKPPQNIDLFGDVPTPPARPSTTDTPSARPPPPKPAAAPPPPKQTKPGDSLLGLDFFGGPPAAASVKPASASSTPGAASVPSRPDLKQSILSLYSSAPRTQPEPQQDNQDVFGGMQSPPAQRQSGFDSLGDAFSRLSFSSSTSPPSTQARPQPKADPFASFSKPSTASRSSFTSPPAKSPAPLSGGGFFDTGTKPGPKPPSATKPTQASSVLQMPSSSSGLGDFSFESSPAPAAKPATSSNSQDLFGFSDPAPPSQPAAPLKPPVPASNINSAFNLSAPSQPAPKSAPSAPANSTSFSGFANDDAWGSNDAWATPEPSTASKPKATIKSPAISSSANDFSAWGNPISSSGFGSSGTTQGPPKIAPDEDFGGWNAAIPEPSATVSKPPQQQTSSRPPGGGFNASEDLFSNVWE
ncbi:MAG: hypothetical protein Q9190_008040 [Brigantiaea leucoxantha]